MRVVATSDFHGYLPEIPECDLLLIAGDVCPVWDHKRQFQANWLSGHFRPWLESVPAKEIVWTGGNHDFVLQDMNKAKRDALGGIYLHDEEITVQGMKIWASPMSPSFGNWAFMRDDKGLGEIWEKIPNDVDILMVHGPMYGCRDWTFFGETHVGSRTLRNRLHYGNFPKLKAVICGHIHEGYGVEELLTYNVYNVSHVDFDYRAVNPPMVFEL